MNSTLSDWMKKKLTRLADERALLEGCLPADALNTLCGEAFTTIRGEMTAFPELSQVLPHCLGRNLRAGAFGSLSALEFAAIVIAEADAQTVSNVAGPDEVFEFAALKIRALADLLDAGEGIKCRM